MSGGLGDSRTASFIFNEGKSSVHAHSTHWNKKATCDFGHVTVINSEKHCFLYTCGLFMGCNKQIVNTAFNRSLNSVDR